MFVLKAKFDSKNLSTYGQVVASLLLVVLIFGLGYNYGKEGNTTPEKDVKNSENKSVDVNFAPFWKAWEELDQKFVAAGTSTAPLGADKKLWGSIQGLAASYGDPYTVFFPPVESKMFAEEISGSFNGVGMEIASQEGFLTVVSPLKGTPAARADVRTGDKIIQIGEKPAARMPVDEAISLIRGERGTTVRITFAREGLSDLLVKEIVREPIEIPTIDYKLLPSGVYLIELYSFTENSPELMRRALRDFAESGSDKLILDLRGNPGGYLEAATSMASWFLPRGKVVVTEDFGGKRENILHRSYGYDVFNDDLKFVILVNGGSASASEILAGALSEYGVATLVGEKTFGKGSVQELVEITPNTSLKVTVAHWLTPNGKSISSGGLAPQIEVARTAEDAKAGRDPQLDKAIEFLTK